MQSWILLQSSESHDPSGIILIGLVWCSRKKKHDLININYLIKSKFKRTALNKTETFFSIINVITVLCEQINASLLIKKNIDLFKNIVFNF